MRQYIIVNESLNMSSGKVAAQVAHAATGYAIHAGLQGSFGSFNDYLIWFERYKQRKIVVKMHEDDIPVFLEILKYEEIPFFAVYDTGANEVPVGSLTAIATKPQYKEYYPRLFAKLRLL